MRKIEPHFIFVHYHDDTHQDHRHLAMSTITATRYTKNVLFYEGPTTQNFAPTVFVDIQQALDRKIRALGSACLASEENEHRRDQYCGSRAVVGAFPRHSGSCKGCGRISPPAIVYQHRDMISGGLG